MLAGVLVLAVYAVVLLLWSSGSEPIAGLPGGAPSIQAGGAPTTAATSASPSPSPSPRRSIDNLSDLLPPLPGSSISADPAGLPSHTVEMTVTSDGAVWRFGYLVAYGHPEKYYALNVKSPVRAFNTGRSFTVVAEIGAQASNLATYITCTLTVDGKVRAQYTAHGGYSVVVCLG